MSHIAIPATIAAAPEASQPGLRAVAQQLGSVPNLFRLIANSPAALQGHLGLGTALAQTRLGAKTLNRIALTVAEVNGCQYCLAAHTYLAKNLAKLDDTEIDVNRRGHSVDAKADAAVQLAQAITRQRGKVSAEVIASARNAGFDDAALVEIVLAVTANVFTNFLNNLANTDVDFPEVAPLS